MPVLSGSALMVPQVRVAAMVPVSRVHCVLRGAGLEGWRPAGWRHWLARMLRAASAAVRWMRAWRVVPVLGLVIHSRMARALTAGRRPSTGGRRRFVIVRPRTGAAACDSQAGGHGNLHGNQRGGAPRGGPAVERFSSMTSCPVLLPVCPVLSAVVRAAARSRGRGGGPVAGRGMRRGGALPAVAPPRHTAPAVPAAPRQASHRDNPPGRRAGPRPAALPPGASPGRPPGRRPGPLTGRWPARHAVSTGQTGRRTGPRHHRC